MPDDKDSYINYARGEIRGRYAHTDWNSPTIAGAVRSGSAFVSRSKGNCGKRHTVYQCKQREHHQPS